MLCKIGIGAEDGPWRKRDRAEGGDAKAEMMMKLQGLFWLKAATLSDANRSSWTFRRQPIYRSCPSHCPPTSRILFPAVHHEIYLTRHSFQKSRCLTEDPATSRAQSVRRCNPIPPPTLTWHTWTTETTTATPMEDPTAVEPMASLTSSATRRPPPKQQKPRTVLPTLSTATTFQSVTLVS
jgi:hypothetical protein